MANNFPYEYIFKYIIIGDMGVGKSCAYLFSDLSLEFHLCFVSLFLYPAFVSRSVSLSVHLANSSNLLHLHTLFGVCMLVFHTPLCPHNLFVCLSTRSCCAFLLGGPSLVFKIQLARSLSDTYSGTL